jgi:hypothetical protein
VVARVVAREAERMSSLVEKARANAPDSSEAR